MRHIYIPRAVIVIALTITAAGLFTIALSSPPTGNAGVATSTPLAPALPVAEEEGGSHARQLETPLHPRIEQARAAVPEHTEGGSTPSTARAVLSIDELIAMHFPPAHRAQAHMVAWCESRFDAAAVGAAGEVGLWQIHPVHWERFGVNAWTLTDPATNAVVAATLVAEQGWRPWTTRFGCRGWGK